MSLLAQIGTRSARTSAHQLTACPKINVLFIVDCTSLLAIIDGMKGLICYASFRVPSGTEKSLTHFQVKDDFFVPGDTVDVQQDRFFLKAVVGLTPSLLITETQHALATVYFFFVLIVRSGRFRFPLAPVAERIRAGHCLSLSSFFHSERAAKGLLN